MRFEDGAKYGKHRRRISRSGKAAILVAASGYIGLPLDAFASPPNSSYRLVFADEFLGNSLDTSKWSAAYPSWTMPNSASTASASQVSVNNGLLTLSATRTSSTAFSSGSISSYGKFNLTSGYIEASIQLPNTPGSWPAFWGLYTGWPPEADIMEYPITTDGGTDGLQNNQYNTAFHYTNSSGGNSSGGGVITEGSTLSTSTHIFAMQWVANTSVAFYLDGVQVGSPFNSSAVSQMASMYMILDYAVGGWPGTPSTSQWPIGTTHTMGVNWVRAWQYNANNDAPSAWNVNGSGSFATAANWTEGVPQYGNEVATFGRVGTAATAAISTGAWQLFGGITFDGLSSGTLSGTTAYTLGTSGTNIQLATTSSSGVVVQATMASTASQGINSNIELYSNTDFENNMTGGETINVNGNLIGAGNLSVDGAGTVILAGTGTYTGTTTIGSAQGPAVLRAAANSALSTGTVTIGTAGNSTTARLEITGGITLPNNVTLSGRNNSSIGIENISGNNILSGTVSANVGGGTYEIQSDGNILTLSGAAAGATAAGVALEAATGSRTFTLQGSGNGAITGIVQDGGGTVSIAKAGTGTWTLSGTNAFSGSINASAGKLVLGDTKTNSGFTVSGGADVQIIGAMNVGGAITSAGTIDMTDNATNTLAATGALSLSNSTLDMELGNGSSSDRITTSGSASISGVNTIKVEAPAGQSITPGASYTVLSASGGGLSASNFVVGTNNSPTLGFFHFGLSTPTANALMVNVTGNATPAVAYWTGLGSSATGDTSNNWGAGASVGTSNWSIDSAGATDAKQVPGSITNVIFTASNATGSSGVSTTQLDATYAINGLSFNVAAAPGINSEVLNSNGSTLAVGSGGVSIASTSNATAMISGTGTVQVNGSQNWANNSNTEGLTVNTGIAALSGATALTFDGTGTGGVYLAGVLADGGGTLSTVFNQAGTTILSATNTYTGTTTVASGTLQINSTGKIVSDSTVDSGAMLIIAGGTDGIGDSNNVNVLPGGTFDVRGATASSAKTETIGGLNGGGLVTRGNAGFTTLTIGGGNLSSTFSGTIQDGSGQLALQKTGNGILTLSGPSTFSGGTTINDGAGTVAITNASALGSGSVTIGTGGTNQSGELQVSGGIAVTSVPTINFESRSLSNAGGSADIENLSGSNSISANLNINNTGGSAVNILSTSGTLTLSGKLSSTGLTSARGFDFYGAGNGLVSGVISNGTAAPTFVQMDGTGTWTLSNNNTFSDGATVNFGTLTFSGNNNFGAGGITVNGTTAMVASGNVFNGGTAILSGSNVYTGGTSIAGGIVVMANTSALGAASNAVTLSANGMLDIQTDGGDTPYNLNVGSGNTIALASDVKTGSVGINHTLGSLAISANTTVDVVAGYNVASGNAAITLGSVTLSSGVGAGSTTFVPTSATVNLGAITTSTNSAKTLILDGTSIGNTITGSITNGSNVITLVKSNTSAWTLSNSNSYGGGTTIDDGGGTLAITNATALGTGSVTIGTGGTNASGELQLSNNIVVTSVPTINLESRLLSNAGGTADIENLSGTNSISANLNINNTGGNAVNILSTAGTLTLNGNLSSTGLSNARGFDFYGTGNGVVTGIISDGTTQPTFIQKDGLGMWTLVGSNTYTGATTINAGTLAIDSSITGSAHASIADTSGVTLGSGAELHLLSAGGTSKMINTAATLSVVTGSIIALDLNGGSQTVQSFVVNGNAAPAGVYSASTEPDGGTTYESLFEGNGSLDVSVPEPGCLGVVGFVAGGLLFRRRRRR